MSDEPKPRNVTLLRERMRRVEIGDFVIRVWLQVPLETTTVRSEEEKQLAEMFAKLEKEWLEHYGVGWTCVSIATEITKTCPGVNAVEVLDNGDGDVIYVDWP